MRRFLRTAVRAAAPVAAAFVCACLLLVGIGTHDRLGRADIAIVPGNLVSGDGQPSPRLRSRCQRALEIYRARFAPVLFVSGGVEPEGRNEAAAMKRWLVARGVPDSAVVTDSLGTNSWLTARHAKQWLERNRRHGAIIVTQGFHVPRMRLACARQGITPLYWTRSRFFETRDFYSIAREIPGIALYAVRSASED